MDSPNPSKTQSTVGTVLSIYTAPRQPGHVAKMDNVRLPLQMMFSTMTGSGTRSRGRPLKSWNECVRDDLAAIGHAYDLWKKCKDREPWKTIIQVLLDVPSP